MDLFHWIEDLLPGHHEQAHDQGLELAGTATSDPAHVADTMNSSALGPSHYEALAGNTAADPATLTGAGTVATGNAFVDHLDSTMAQLQAQTNAYLEHVESTPTAEPYGSNTEFMAGLQSQMHEAGDIYDGALESLTQPSHVESAGLEGNGVADPYHSLNASLEADTTIHSAENATDIWENNLSTENQVDAALGQDEGL